MPSFLLRVVSRLVFGSTTASPIPEPSTPDLARIFATYVDPVRALDQLIEKSGGTWPPNPTFKRSWPAPLQVYHSAYQIVAPLFPVLESSIDDAENRQTIDAMRARIRGLLSGDPTFAHLPNASDCLVDMKSVVSILSEADQGSTWIGYDEQTMQSALLGFCACICFLRLVYRWGVSPVVRQAQIETSIAFPAELDVPWQHMQNHFGFTSPGPSLSTCLYFNNRGVQTNFKPFYSSVYGLPYLHQRTAQWDMRLFLETEYRSLPMYRLLALTISACTTFSSDYPLAALASLKEANVLFQNTSRFFFDNMKDTNISHALWLAYLQGYTGWALKLPGQDGVVVSGVSDGHSLTIRTLDAFLGIRPFPQPAEEALHLPVAQRDWLESLREYDIRARVQSAIEQSVDASDIGLVDFWQEMQDELQKMVGQLRLWRMGHMSRMMAYEGVHRPERIFMTAGRFIPPEGEAFDETGMVEHLKVLQERLTETV
ncbi:hypothetical protein C8J56DRAFT_1047298 [Mycena floridula]|nr:hypothetical protein C8J56DRAFT_1047298 [Mycena floridula]